MFKVTILLQDLHAGLEAVLYSFADDLVLWDTNKRIPTIMYRMQRAVAMLKLWTEAWHVTTINLKP